MWVGVLSFLAAMAFAIAVVVFRTPWLPLNAPNGFRTALMLHVELAVFVWLMTTSMVIAVREWSSASERAAINLSLLAAAGILLMILSPLGTGEPVMLDYFPWLMGNTYFLYGMAGFTVAVIAGAWISLWQSVARGKRTIFGNILSSPAFSICLTSIALVVDFFRSAAFIELAWSVGHLLLFAHSAQMVTDWPDSSGRHWKARVVMTISVLSLCSLLGGQLVELGSSQWWHWYTNTMSWLLWPPALLYGLFLSFNKTGAGDPRLSRVIRVAAFLIVIGCLIGLSIDGATTIVTAHYHATMGAVAISRMAALYRLQWRADDRWVLGRREFQQIQLYALALLFLLAGLFIAGVDGAARKTSAGEVASHGSYYAMGMGGRALDR